MAEESLEIAHISAIMMSEIDFDKFYALSANKEGGFIGSTYKIAEWALEFYKQNKDTDWENLIWDEEISNFVKNKIYEYERNTR